MPVEIDVVTIEATLTGAHGRAWRVDLDDCYRAAGKARDEGAEIAMWIVEARFAHPLWHSYWIELVHLRPFADKRPTKFYLEGATHEVWVYALDPNHSRDQMIRSGAVNALTPKNFAAQFIEPSDEAAAERVQQAVRMICDGKLSPDTDFIRSWAALFGDNMIKK